MELIVLAVTRSIMPVVGRLVVARVGPLGRPGVLRGVEPIPSLENVYFFGVSTAFCACVSVLSAGLLPPTEIAGFAVP